MIDLTFKVSEKEKFNVRSAAIIKYQDNYLISKREDKDYYSITGGKVTFGEDSKTAILRELKEELDFDIARSDARLVRIIENFYTYNDGTKFHEYLFVYLIELGKEYFEKGNFINKENTLMHMIWFKENVFLFLNIKPQILKDVVENKEFKHITLNG